MLLRSENNTAGEEERIHSSVIISGALMSGTQHTQAARPPPAAE